ncbi:MBL fold metallo-hydrolase [Oscillibacter sp.]|uniref:MBL fold metallo-hydrolase n=1 Tax=Oscillibacter sp. TaxID=1945593 RepID=UPI002609F1D2|nr:MBL fold metallo-hydrolase [Oscillibacter sp.]MDD3346941.1 MBL fold metallo-hydrolase [Oscillibacter sp.]
MTTVHTLASGSSGNALLLTCNATHLLIDAGISCRRITASLRQLGLGPEDLDAVFITHVHTDHISGLQTLLKRTACPVSASERTCRELEYRLAGISDRLSPLPLCRPVSLGDCTITAFPTSHDAPGCCGYRADTPDGSVGLLTDTGYVTGEAGEILPGAELVFLEANHDPEVLRSGPYPYYLKQRILGREGHLSNADAAQFAVTLAQRGTRELVLSHLSRENNTPAMALQTVETALSAADIDPELSVAPRSELSGPHTVCRRPLCKK